MKRRLLLMLAVLAVCLSAGAKGVSEDEYWVRDIAYDAENIYVATHKHGLVVINRETGEQTNYTEKDGLLSNEILTLLPHGDELLLGYQPTGYGILKDGKVENYMKDGLGVVFDAVHTMAFDEDGTLWMGFGVDLAKIVDNQLVKAFRNDNKDGKRKWTVEYIHQILVDNDGSVWAVGDGFIGLSHLTEDGFHWIPTVAAPTSIAVDAEGNKWVTTLKGLGKYENGDFTIYGDSVHTEKIQIGEDGRIWFLEQNAVVVFDGTYFTRYVCPNEKKSMETLRLIDGEVYVGGYTIGVMKLQDGEFVPVPIKAFEPETTGIDNLTTAPAASTTTATPQYFDLSGKRVAAGACPQQKGVYVERTILANGTVRSRKIAR